MKISMAIAIAALVAGAAWPARASTGLAYVTCQFSHQGKPEVRKFTLNEALGKVTIYYPETAESQTVQAGFSAEIVVFETYVDRYAINRTSLVGVRQAKLDGHLEKVQCQIETPAKRAF